MRFVVLLKPGAAWIAGRSIDEQDEATLGAHLASLSRLYAEGAVLLAGPFVGEDGGLIVLEASDQTAARSVMDGDPAVAGELLVYDLKEIDAIFDVVAGKSWVSPGDL